MLDDNAHYDQGPARRLLTHAAIALVCVAPLCPPSAEATEYPRPLVTITRTDSPPVIDGHLDDATWQNAAVIDSFRQVEPVEGADPSERTVAYLAYDDDNIYIAVRCFDSEPEKIVAHQLVEDSFLLSEARVNVMLDTLFDRRNAYLFQVTPLGTSSEGRAENQTTYRHEWDAIWSADSTIDEHGWSTEMAIPFKSVSLDANSTRWGLEIERHIRRRNEKIKWGSISQSYSITDPANYGTMEGLEGIQQGLGLDIQPSLAMSSRWNAEAGGPGTGDQDLAMEPSVNVFYRATPSMTAAFTANTDFSDADVDLRQTNLTRFSLFFPETRDFFIEDAGVFEFGGLKQNGTPFFSRRIGLDADARPVDLVVGAKLAGHVGPWDLGLLDVVVGDSAQVDSKNLTVARATRDLGSKSRAGFIATHGDPLSDDDNTLAGLDYRYRDSRVAGDQVLVARAWSQKSWTDPATGQPPVGDKELAWGVSLDWPNDRWNAGASVAELQEDFLPALGFANRTGIRDYRANLRYRHRPDSGPVRHVDSGFTARTVTDTGDKLESVQVDVDYLVLSNQAGDKLSFAWSFLEEDTSEDFEIVEGTIIPPGDYRYQRPAVRLDTSKTRPVAGKLHVKWGEFYSGNMVNTAAVLELRPSPHFFLSWEHQMIDAQLPEGDFTIHLSRLGFDVNPSTRVSWRNLVQWDNQGDQPTLNSRLRWIPEPGRELSLVVNQAWDKSGSSFTTTTADYTLRLSWTQRY